MPGEYLWTPPRRNTEDPDRPPLPGMERKAPRITPSHPRYRHAGDSEVWGSLAHPDLHEQNPFLTEHDDSDDGFRGRTWRQDTGGYTDRYENVFDEPEHLPQRMERRIQRTIDKALPAIAIDTDPLHKVLDSGRLKSQFETNTSRGSLAPRARREVENQMFGYSHDLPDHARPIYGYLTHDPFQHHPEASRYGRHTLILHRPRIWHRTSAFIGDTLADRDEGHSAHPVQDFRLSGFPRFADPKEYRLDYYRPEYDYTEAQYHGGVGHRDIHYAVLHKPNRWAGARHQGYDDLKPKLDRNRIPWVEMDNDEPVDWEHHLARRFAGVMRGANMNPETSRVIGQQGPGRYLIDLGYDDHHGNRQAQIADTNTGELHPPMLKDSILARGYWEEPDHEVGVEEILPKVRPV